MIKDKNEWLKLQCVSLSNVWVHQRTYIVVCHLA